MSDDPRLRQWALQTLESLQASGISHLPWPADAPPPREFWAPRANPVPSAANPVQRGEGHPAAAHRDAASPSAGSLPAKGFPVGANHPAPARAQLPESAPSSRPPTAPVGVAVPPGLREQPSTTDSPTRFELAADYSPALDLPARISGLETLRSEVAGCTRCKELVTCRSRTVFGVGPPAPQLCLVGEAPGADEDRIGEPFVGAAGQLLDRILKACKLERSDVYILNVLKCRPPQNRTPMDPEVANCWGYAEQQLDLLQPAFICCLGSVAARAVLQTRESISRLRGRLHAYRNSQVVVTWHPAYLLRTPAAKQQTWDDMKMLMSAMGRPV